MKIDRLRRDPATPILALCVLAAAIRFWRIGQQGFWFDEANTALLVHQSAGKMLSLIPQTESTPPLYYCVAWVWARVFGSAEAGLRSLSAVCGVATVPFAYLAGERLLAGLFDARVARRAGLLAAALTACNPFLIWYSQEARSYSMLVLLSAAALACFVAALERPSRRNLLGWTALSALALATHYFAIVAIVPEGAWLLWRHRRSRELWTALGLLAVCAAALLPLAIAQDSTGHDSWIANSDIWLRLSQVIPQALIGTGAPARAWLKFAALALALWALIGLARAIRELSVAGASKRSVPSGTAQLLAPLSIAVGGFLLALALAPAGSDSLITRNLIALWLPAALSVALGAALLAPRAVRAAGGVAIVAGLCTIGLVAAIGVATTPDLQRPDWRPVARVLGAEPRPAGATRLILIQHYRTLLPLSLYLPGLRFVTTPAVAGVREIDVLATTAPGQALCWWGAACNLHASGLQRSYPIPGFRPLWLRHARRFSVLRLVAATAQTVSWSEFDGALTGTHLGQDDLLVQR